MAEITAKLVKDLRERTGAGMMDCKKALTESDGDIDAAVDWLRTKGLAAAAKKAGRVAAEGLVGVATEGKSGSVVELNAETDFVARNDAFQQIVSSIADIALKNGGDLAAVKGSAFPGSDRNVEDEITHQIATIGENMSLRRCEGITVGNGVVSQYVHNAHATGLGRIGVIVGLESEGDAAKLNDLGKQIAMHIAAATPLALSRDDLDASYVEKERNVLIEQARESGKPDNIIEKMIEGRLRKYFEEVCLLDQVFVIDGETRVSKVLENAAKEVGGPVAIAGFVRFQLGEGVEKEEADFAAEVAATAGG
jgi:elongation factor Ts